MDFSWFFRNAVGFPGLPPLAGKAADVALIVLVLWGAIASWRAGHRPLALAMLAGALGFPVLLAMLNLIAPLMQNRYFLPAGLCVAVLAGLGISSLRPVWLKGSCAAALVLALGASSLHERQVRTKYEDIPAALRIAASQGARHAPYLTCSFFTAGSVWAADPSKPAYIVLWDGVLRFDAGFIHATRMSLAQLFLSDARTIDRFLGGGYLAPGGLDKVLAGSSHAVAILQPCQASFEPYIDAELAARGLRRVWRGAVRDLRGAQTVMERGETVVAIYRRDAGPQANTPKVSKAAGADPSRL